MFVALEYAPRRGQNRDGVHTPLRQDGHYTDRADALEVARMWAAKPITAHSVVVVAEIVERVSA